MESQTQKDEQERDRKHLKDEIAYADKMMAEERERAEEAHRQWAEAERKIGEHNKRILLEIELSHGKEYVDDIRACLEESEADGKLEIINEMPREDWKDMEDWGSFKYIYVDQYITGGFTGDEFAGYIYIPLKKKKFLKTHYSM